MIAHVNLLALFFFTICNGQVTYWTGGGGSSNNTFSDATNWSNGAPTATSIVYINETTCADCDIVVDKPVKVAELHLGAATGTGPRVQINGGSLTVTTAFTLGSANPTTAYVASIVISGGGMFVIDTGCAASIYYTGDDSISSNDAADNWFINKGTVTVYGNNGLSVGSVYAVNIGTESYVLNIANYGSWDVTDGKAQLIFYYVNNFHIYGGSFKGAVVGSSGYSSIYFDTVDVVLQDGSGRDATGAGGVTFEGIVAFHSYYTQDNNYAYASVPPASLIFNTTGVTVSNALFVGVNILFLYDGWLMDCNITAQSFLNSTVSGVHAYINGTNNIVDDSAFTGINTDFIVQVETGTTVTMPSEFTLLGSVTLINNGIWIYNSGDYLYWDAVAYWINLGLIEVTTHSNDFIVGSSFYGSPATSVGTLVNMGTIQFSDAGGMNFHQASGTFLQCTKGIIKFVYDSSSPGTVTLPSVTLDGYLGISYKNSAPPSSSETLFSFIPDANSQITPVFSGNLEVISKLRDDSGLPLTYVPLVCYDKSGSVTFYDSIVQKAQCPDPTESQFLTPTVSGACSGLDDKIKNLADSASCPATVTCGADTGTASGGSPPTSAASLNVTSLAFLVSLVCLLLKF